MSNLTAKPMTDFRSPTPVSCWLRLAVALLLWVAAQAGPDIRYRCLPEQPAWQALPSDGDLRLREVDVARGRQCELLASGLGRQWLTLNAIPQSHVYTVPAEAGQAPASVVWRSARSAAIEADAQGHARVVLDIRLPIGSRAHIASRQPAAFLAEDGRDAQIRTALLWLLGAIGLTSAVFALALRDATMGWYAGFTLALALIWALLTGHAIHPTALALHAPLFSSLLLLLGYGATLVCGLRFALAYCNLAQRSPRLHGALLALSFAVMGITALGLVPAFSFTVINYFNLLALFTLPAMLLPGLVCLRARSWRTGAFYLAGWLPVLLSWFGLLLLFTPGTPGYPHWLTSLAQNMIDTGLLPDWLGSTHTRQLAQLTQAIIFALALADRAVRLRRKRNRAALSDSITGLPNRAHFLLAGERQLRRAGQAAHTLALFDITEFTTINETLGYDCGDDVLRETASRLARKLGPASLLARVGSNQFAALLDDSPSEGTLGLLAGSLGRQAFQLGEQSLDIRLRCGAAQYPEQGDELEALMRRAEIALADAKQHKLSARSYHEGLERDQRFQLSLLSALRSAMARQELQLFLQPKADCQSGEICGAEVLLRWQHPQHGLVAPRDFLPFAECTGLIVELTRWMLAEALRLAKHWQLQGRALQLSLNLSAADLADPNLPAHMAGFLMHSRANPQLLTLEITESEVMRDPALAIASLRALRTLGFRLALDDFGTGNSTLAYLQEMPVSEIKIDRSFVARISHEPRSLHLLQAMLRLAHSLDLHTVAEGVETAEEWALLRAADCREIQGYFLAAPMPLARFDSWLASYEIPPLLSPSLIDPV